MRWRGFGVRLESPECWLLVFTAAVVVIVAVAARWHVWQAQTTCPRGDRIDELEQAVDRIDELEQAVERLEQRKWAVGTSGAGVERYLWIGERDAEGNLLYRSDGKWSVQGERGWEAEEHAE